MASGRNSLAFRGISVTLCEQLLSDVANAAQILTAGVAIFFGIRTAKRSRDRRLRLEDYLKLIRIADDTVGKHGLRTPMRISVDLAMPVEDVQAAAFRSKLIKRWPATDAETGRADGLFLQFEKLPRSNAR